MFFTFAPRPALKMLLQFPRSIWIVAACVTVWTARQQVGALPHVTYSHAGICPNDMNPNLWVDAMSTCTRECQSDKVSSTAHVFDEFVL